MPTASLAELIAASASGDERAFRRLYQATSGALFGVALRITRRRDWAEEVLQESYVSVWRHAGRYDDDKGAPMTWLIRIVRNQALDWLEPSRPDRVERDHGVSVNPNEEPLPGAEGTSGADAMLAVDASRDALRIAGCLGSLDARQRQSIALVFFHGLTHSELARHLHEPLGTVKAWVRRGLKHLRACLGAMA